ncbi:MAG: ATP-dependent DNA helicase, partial [Lachnospiraceae bacterium]|nr:ATP-dependent DNA helicase [Lachnospiraceae bacterium]
YQVCPFEMCLDTTTWADNIICDYNYVFDPNVYLKRFFSDGIRGDYIFLVDEAHNLVERGREMYSAKLYKEDFLAVRKILKVLSPAVEREFTKCNKLMLAYKRECDTCQIYENIPDLIFALMRLGARMDEFMQKHPQFPGRDEVSDFYFALRNFLNIYERVDDHYVIYGQHEEDGRFAVKLFCVDPSYNLQECVDKANATVFFSATLLPIQYYKKLLTTKTDVYAVYAQTTFSQEQRLLLIGTDVSSKYTRRSKQEYRNFAEYIYRTAKSRTGNYIAFFPSYLFLDQVYEQFMDIMDGNMEVLRQESSMREAEREEFLLSFTQERDASMVAFCVLGGIFGEGIDLKEEQLIGAIIVGTGLPQISREREILKDYYDERGMSGFDYAYRFPGMNKVLQAAGRVIRTAADVGVIELLDERFLQSDYRALFPREWEQRSVCNLSNVERRLDEFWKQF